MAVQAEGSQSSSASRRPGGVFRSCWWPSAVRTGPIQHRTDQKRSRKTEAIPCATLFMSQPRAPRGTPHVCVQGWKRDLPPDPAGPMLSGVGTGAPRSGGMPARDSRIHHVTGKRPIRLTSTSRCPKWRRHNRDGNPLRKRPEPVQINRATSALPLNNMSMALGDSSSSAYLNPQPLSPCEKLRFRARAASATRQCSLGDHCCCR